VQLRLLGTGSGDVAEGVAGGFGLELIGIDLVGAAIGRVVPLAVGYRDDGSSRG
jgi:hypothetical protein